MARRGKFCVIHDFDISTARFIILWIGHLYYPLWIGHLYYPEIRSKPLPEPAVPGVTEAKRMDNAARWMFSVSKKKC